MNKYRIKFKNGEERIITGNAVSNNDNGDYVIIGAKNENLVIIDAESFNYIEKVETNKNVASTSETK